MKGLGDSQRDVKKAKREKIFSLLGSEWRSYTDLVKETRFSTKTVSKNLKDLMAEGEVERRIDTHTGKQPIRTYYRRRHPWTPDNPRAHVELGGLTRFIPEGIHPYRSAVYVDPQLEIGKDYVDALNVNLQQIDDLFKMIQTTFLMKSKQKILDELLGDPERAKEYGSLGLVVHSFESRHRRSGVVGGAEGGRVDAEENKFLEDLEVKYEDLEDLRGDRLEELHSVLIMLNVRFRESGLTERGFAAFSGYRRRLMEDQELTSDLEALMREREPAVVLVASTDNVRVSYSDDVTSKSVRV
jgi:hypothetical protein